MWPSNPTYILFSLNNNQNGRGRDLCGGGPTPMYPTSWADKVDGMGWPGCGDYVYYDDLYVRGIALCGWSQILETISCFLVAVGGDEKEKGKKVRFDCMMGLLLRISPHPNKSCLYFSVSFFSFLPRTLKNIFPHFFGTYWQNLHLRRQGRRHILPANKKKVWALIWSEERKGYFYSSLFFIFIPGGVVGRHLLETV